MISSAEIKQMLSTENEKSFIYYIKKIISILLYFAVGILFAGINELGAFSPFGVAYTTAAKPEYLIPCATGAALGYILTQDSVTALRYIAATVSATVIIRLLYDVKKFRKFSLLPSAVSFLTLGLTSAVMLVSNPSQTKSFLIFFGEAVIGFISAYFISSCFGAVELFKQQDGFNLKDISCISITLFIFLLSIEDISFFGISASRIFATLFILLMSYIYKEAGGAVTSAAAAFVLSISTDVGPLGMLYCASGFAAGMLSHSGKYVISSVYFFTYSVMFILNSSTYEESCLVIECLIACIVFAFIKKDVLEKLSVKLVILKQPSETEIHRRVISERLRTASRAIEAMLKSISAASGILKYQTADNEISIYSKIKEEVCEDCRHNKRCWEKNAEDCLRAFDKMSDTLKDCGMVNRSNMPKYLSGCCVKSERLADVFNRSYLNYIIDKSNQNKIEKIRQITAEQFNCVYTVISEVSQPFGREQRFDGGRADRVEEMLLNRFGIKAQSVVCIIDDNDKMRLELTFNDKLSKIKESDLKPAIEEACETQFDKPVIVEKEKSVVLCMCQKTKYRVEIAAARVVADKQKHCGDNFESFYDGKGNYIIILSDGMGTGMRACVDSSLAVCVCGNLLRSGFDYESVIKLANCAMLLTSVEESIATLDILKINLYTGQVAFYKAGAAVSFIKKKEKVVEIRQASMPIGIISEVNFSTVGENMEEGNIAMLASDGAFEYSSAAVKNSLAVSFDEKVEEIAERSATVAKKAGKGKRNDDITVIAARLVKNK